MNSTDRQHSSQKVHTKRNPLQPFYWTNSNMTEGPFSVHSYNRWSWTVPEIQQLQRTSRRRMINDTISQLKLSMETPKAPGSLTWQSQNWRLRRAAQPWHKSLFGSRSQTSGRCSIWEDRRVIRHPSTPHSKFTAPSNRMVWLNVLAFPNFWLKCWTRATNC